MPLPCLTAEQLFTIADMCCERELRALPCVSRSMENVLRPALEELWANQVGRMFDVMTLPPSRTIPEVGGIAIWSDPELYDDQLGDAPEQMSWRKVYDCLHASGLTSARWPLDVLMKRVAWTRSLPALARGAQRHGIDVRFLAQASGLRDVALLPFWLDDSFYVFGFNFIPSDAIDSDHEEGDPGVKRATFSLACYLAQCSGEPYDRPLTATVHLNIGGQTHSFSLDVAPEPHPGVYELHDTAGLVYKQKGSMASFFPNVLFEAGLLEKAPGDLDRVLPTFVEDVRSEPLPPLPCALDVAYTPSVKQSHIAPLGAFQCHFLMTNEVPQLEHLMHDGERRVVHPGVTPSLEQ